MLYILLRYHPYVLLNSGIFLLITVITISLLRNIFRYYSKLLFQFTVTMLLGNITLLIVEWRPNDISDGFCTYLGNFSKKWYFVTKNVLTYCEKKNVLVIKIKLLKFEMAENLQNC